MTLVQQYLFMPAQVKTCYLIQALRTMMRMEGNEQAAARAEENKRQARAAGKRRRGGGKGKASASDAALVGAVDQSAEAQDEMTNDGLALARSAIIFTGDPNPSTLFLVQTHTNTYRFPHAPIICIL